MKTLTMGLDRGLGLARVFCTAFKQYLEHTQTTAATATYCGATRTSIFSSKSNISQSLFVPHVRLQHQACSKQTGAVVFLCVKHQALFGLRTFSSTPNNQGPRRNLKFRRINLLREFLLKLRILFLQTYTANMLGGRRRRSLRLSSSSSRREPLTVINNLTNANEGLNGDHHHRPITVSSPSSFNSHV